MDMLAYNTYYNSFYLNMLANEMFLDTAELRNSVVQKAKQMGYTPRSVQGTKAIVTLNITPNDTATTMVVEKDRRFSSIIDNNKYISALEYADVQDIQTLFYKDKEKLELRFQNYTFLDPDREDFS